MKREKDILSDTYCDEVQNVQNMIQIIIIIIIRESRNNNDKNKTKFITLI